MRIHEVAGSGGLRLHLRERGRADGPSILLIHGWSQCHLRWAKQYESAFADDFRLVAFDLRGHGMPEAPLEQEYYTGSRPWADDLQAIIDALRLEREASWYDGVGHGPHLEDPARFNRELAALSRRVHG